MSKYLGSLMSQGNVFDEQWFDNLEELKQWAKGRNKYYNTFDGKFHRYSVQIYIPIDDGLDLYDEYLEE